MHGPSLVTPLATLVILTTGMVALADDPPHGLDQIVSAQAGINSLEGRFRQTKTLSLFDEVIESSGIIIIEKPDFYCWIYDEPEHRVFFVDGSRVGFVEPGSESNTGAAPQSAALVDMIQSVSALISGNLRASALKDYEINSRPSVDDTLRYDFVPLSSEAQALFGQVTISFDPRTGLARELEIVENNGDTSVMKFEDWQENIVVNRSELVE